MIIAHAIRDLDRQSGGPSRSVPGLCKALAVSPFADEVRLWFRGSQETVVVDEQPGLVLCDLTESSPQFGDIDCLHLHGLWTPVLHRLVVGAVRRGIPYVISTRGMLAEWCLEHKKWKKRLALWLYQRRDLSNASAIHVTSSQEGADVARLFPSARIAEVPNGCMIPEHFSKPSSCEVRRALVICRLHPVKQLDMLIRLWIEIRPTGWELEIAGPGDSGYVSELKSLIKKAPASAISITGEVHDDEKWAKLSRADIFILPSATENFGMSIAEAMASGTPVLTTNGTPWKNLDEIGAGWTAGVEISEFGKVLRRVLTHSRQDFAAMGILARAYIEENFSWDRIAGQMLELYGKLD